VLVKLPIMANRLANFYDKDRCRSSCPRAEPVGQGDRLPITNRNAKSGR
jgi:hypothetical protein